MGNPVDRLPWRRGAAAVVSTGGRPQVSVVVPFAGPAADGRRLLEALGVLSRRPGDEVIVVDNSPAGVLAPLAGAGIAIIAAPARRSSYHARNVGARAAGGEWLLFLDADCRPAPTLLDDYFAAGADD